MDLSIESATIFLLISHFILSERLLQFPFLPLQRLLLVFEILNDERQTTVPHKVGIPDKEEGDLELGHLVKLDLVKNPGADEVPLSLDIDGLIRNSYPVLHLLGIESGRFWAYSAGYSAVFCERDVKAHKKWVASWRHPTLLAMLAPAHLVLSGCEGESPDLTGLSEIGSGSGT